MLKENPMPPPQPPPHLSYLSTPDVPPVRRGLDPLDIALYIAYLVFLAIAARILFLITH